MIAQIDWFNPSHWTTGTVISYLLLCAVAIVGGWVVGRTIKARRNR